MLGLPIPGHQALVLRPHEVPQCLPYQSGSCSVEDPLAWASCLSAASEPLSFLPHPTPTLNGLNELLEGRGNKVERHLVESYSHCLLFFADATP